MRVAALTSGGKDSIYAAYLVSLKHELCAFLTALPTSEEARLFHFPNAKLVKLQARACGLEFLSLRTEVGEKAERETLLMLLRQAKERFGINAIVAGVIKSSYQYKAIREACELLDLKLLVPLWKKDEKAVLTSMLRDGVKAMITSVAAAGFDRTWLGRELDFSCLRELIRLRVRYKINLSGEGGEYETFVLDCPLFKKAIKPVKTRISWDERTESGYLLIEKAILVEK